MRTCRVVARGRLIEFRSPYGDEEALELLEAHLVDDRIHSRFAQELRERAGRTQLTRKQLDWVHKLVLDAELPTPMGFEQKRIRIVNTGQTRKPGSHRWSPGS